MANTNGSFTEALKAVAEFLMGVPPDTWGPVIILCGFALAAFAIYAVLSVSRGKP